MRLGCGGAARRQLVAATSAGAMAAALTGLMTGLAAQSAPADASTWTGAQSAQSAQSALSDASTWYAYPDGGASSPVRCPQTAAVARQCTLGQALGLARAGDKVALAVSGDESEPTTFYSGGFSVSTAGTSAAAPVRIGPAAGVKDPILDGGGTQRVLRIGHGIYAVIDAVTIQHGNAAYGGGLMLATRTDVTVTGSTFMGNRATYNGGAIVSGYKGDTGTLTLTDSTFTRNKTTKGSAHGGGGAITSGFRGTGTLTVTGSTFMGNTTQNGGGAITSGEGGVGTLTVTGSTFIGNGANLGGAIDSGQSGTGTLTVKDSTFAANTAKDDGGAVASGEFSGGSGRFTVTGSTFTGNSAGGDGGAVDSGDGGGHGTLTVTSSTFAGNTAADGNGGAIDSGDYTGTGALTVTGSTFTGNTAQGDGSTIDGGDNRGKSRVMVGANVFDGSCDQGSGSWTDLGYNTAGDASCFSSPPATGDDDSAGSGLSGLLGPLSDNGGPTQTVALLAGNPGISAVPNGGPTALKMRLCPVRADQRGVASPAGEACDTGAVQLAGQSVTFTSDPPAHARVGGTYRVKATATSRLRVSFSIDPTTPPGVCTVSGSTVSFTGVGTCVIDADQGGDNEAGTGNWLAAATVSQQVVVKAR